VRGSQWPKIGSLQQQMEGTKDSHLVLLSANLALIVHDGGDNVRGSTAGRLQLGPGNDGYRKTLPLMNSPIHFMTYYVSTKSRRRAYGLPP
jgi:hypothetical protein